MLARGNTEEAARLRRAKSIPVVAARRSLAPTFPEDPLAAFKTAITAASCAFDKAKHDAHARGSLEQYLHNVKPATSPKKPTTRRPHTAQGRYLAQKNSEGRLHARQQNQATKKTPNVLPKSGKLSFETRLPQENSPMSHVPANKDPHTRASTRQSDRLSLSTGPSNRTLRKSKSAYTPRTPASQDAPLQYTYGRRRQICTNTNTAYYQDVQEPVSSFTDIDLGSSGQPSNSNHAGSGSRSSTGLRTLKSILALPSKLRGSKSHIEIRPPVRLEEIDREASNYIDAYSSRQNKSGLRNRAKAITASVRTRVENAFKRSPGTGIHSPLRYQQLNANRPHYGSGIVADLNNLADFDSAQHVDYTYGRLFSPSPRSASHAPANADKDRATANPYEIDLTHSKLAESRMTSWANSSGKAISQRDFELSSSAGTTVQNRNFSFPRRSTDTCFSERRVGRIIPRRPDQNAETRNPVDTKRLHSALLKKMKGSTLMNSQVASVPPERSPSYCSSEPQVDHTTTTDVHGQSSTVRLLPAGPTSVQFATTLMASRSSVVSPSVYSPMMSRRRPTKQIDQSTFVNDLDCGTAVVAASQPVASWTVGRPCGNGETTKPNTSNDWRAWVSNEISGIESVTNVLPEGYVNYPGGVTDSGTTWPTTKIVGRQQTYHGETAPSHDTSDDTPDWDHRPGTDCLSPTLPLLNSQQDSYGQNMVAGVGTTAVVHDGPECSVPQRLASDGHHTTFRANSNPVMNDRFPWLDRRHTSARGPSAANSRKSSVQTKHLPSRHAVAETISDFTGSHPVLHRAHVKPEAVEFLDLPVLAPRLSSNVSKARPQAPLRNPSRTPVQPIETSVDTATLHDQETRDTILMAGRNPGKPHFSLAEYPLDEKFLRRIQKGPYLPMSPSPSPPRPKSRLTRQSTSPREQPSFGALRNVENVPLRPKRFMVDTFLESRSNRSYESTNDDGSPAFL